MSTLVSKTQQLAGMLWLAAGLITTTGSAQSLDHRLFSEQAPVAAVLNINDFVIWTRHDGLAGRNAMTEMPTIYPRGTAMALYQDGLIWGGYVNDNGKADLRVGGFNYRVGTIPGAIGAPGVAEDSTNAQVRVYRIRKDYATADLGQDAADFLNKPLTEITADEVARVRAQYQKDWEEWPVQKGAPFYDHNGNGLRDPGEDPGLLDADMVLWFVANDLSETRTTAFYGSKPIGLETQVTWWGYRPASLLLKNTVFMRYRLVYKGTVQSTAASVIENMHVTKWVDADLGDFADDFVGCDSTSSLGFVYNSSQIDAEYRKYNMIPPAVGYVLLQGPIVPATPDERAIFDFKERMGFKNVPMTSFIGKFSGTVYSDPPYGTGGARMYNWIRGYLPLDDVANPRRYFDHNSQPTKFLLYGDPVNKTGWIDGVWPANPPGDRRFLLNTGPFRMARGDTQEVVYALVGAPGTDNRGNVTIAKFFARLLHSNYPNLSSLVTVAAENITHPPRNFKLGQSYPNPLRISGPNHATTIAYSLPEAAVVRLQILNLLGQEIVTLVEARQPAGEYAVRWDGADRLGRTVPSGIYFYRFEARGVQMMKKIVLLP